DWLAAIKSEADAYDIWNYVDPDQLPHDILTNDEPQRPAREAFDNLEEFKMARLDWKDDYSIFEKIQRVEARILTLIRQTIHRDILYMIKDSRTSYQILRVLKARFAPDPVTRQLELERDYK
ncbi:hypothetical protein K402DRAFT_303550, partial [Aulographum hederae CBS 113979]